jgi:hypothetical protein
VVYDSTTLNVSYGAAEFMYSAIANVAQGITYLYGQGYAYSTGQAAKYTYEGALQE